MGHQWESGSPSDRGSNSTVGRSGLEAQVCDAVVLNQWVTTPYRGSPKTIGKHKYLHDDS